MNQSMNVGNRNSFYFFHQQSSIVAMTAPLECLQFLLVAMGYTIFLPIYLLISRKSRTWTFRSMMSPCVVPGVITNTWNLILHMRPAVRLLILSQVIFTTCARSRLCSHTWLSVHRGGVGVPVPGQIPQSSGFFISLKKFALHKLVDVS